MPRRSASRPIQIETALGAAFGGQQVSQIYTSIDQYQVILELLPQYQQDANALSRLYLKGPDGAMVPLTAVTKISRGLMPLTINHSGQIPSVTISFDLAPGKALSDAVQRDGQGDWRDRLAANDPGQLLPEPPRPSRARPAIWACCC